MLNDIRAVYGIFNFKYQCIMRFGCCLLAFAGGMLVGGVAAALFAPKRGDELRRDIKQKIDEAKEHIGKEMGCCRGEKKVVKDDVIVSFEE